MGSRQNPKPYVLYHAPCADGFGAAYAAWRYFGDGAKYIGVSPGGKLPELRRGAKVYMLDVSFGREATLKLAATNNIVVIDHHKSAADELVDIPWDAGVVVEIDTSRSGAVLAWRSFRPLTEMPILLNYIEDRDLWTWELPHSREVSAALATYPFDFGVWHQLMLGGQNTIERLRGEGEALVRLQKQQVEALAQEVRTALIGGYRVPAVNAPYFLASELGNFLIQTHPDAPFAGVYRDAGDGRRDWSLRSENGRIDVSEVAKSLGGGGHRNAAGCSEAVAFEKITFE